VPQTLFGTRSNDDADCYQNKEGELELKQLSVLRVAKKQMAVVHFTLQAVNSTLVDIAANELQISENLKTMQKHINENLEKTNQAFSQTTLLIATNHIIQHMEHFIGQMKEEYDALLFAIIFAQKGILSPLDILTEPFRTPIRFFRVTFSCLPQQEWLTNMY
jgi:hypothetical protein